MSEKLKARRSKSNADAGVARKVKRLVPALLGWFAHSARDLPWRRTRDPYAIWVSEIMLQQTQVKTVIPFWERWMRELPTMQKLADARPEKVLKLWEGLGYYTRVRNLQKAAQVIVARHDGAFPADFDDVLALPGIGRYTAGAICSIAFHQPTPILDGNVIRVLTRLFGIQENPRDKETNARLWKLAEQLVRAAASQSDALPRNCSHLNQSLMELGALVCTPRQPNCAACPVRPHCVAWREDLVGQLPHLSPRAASTARRFLAFVMEHDGKVLVRQRPGGVVNAHLWEFPNLEVFTTATLSAEATRLALGMKVTPPTPLCVIKHSITRYRITLEAFRARLQKAPGQANGAGRWLGWDEVNALPFTSAHRRILERAARPKPERCL